MTDNKYSKGKIYRLVNSVDSEEYVGSTCDTLAKRLYNHKKKARQRASTVYNHLNNIGFENVSIVLVEEYPCENKMQLERRERYWIEQMQPRLNHRIPTRTMKEWYASYYADNKNEVLQKQSEYRANNRDEINKRARDVRANNIESRREYQREYMRKYNARKKAQTEAS